MGYFGIPFRNGVPIGLGSIVGFGAQQFDPSELFVGGTAGAWYDPSDLSTMFTTDAGTTPVAMPGGGAAVSVGRMLDKSGNGNHAIAFNNTTARPELRARVNLLTYSEEFDNGAWAKINAAVTANTVVAPDGTLTADTASAVTTGTFRAIRRSPAALTINTQFVWSVSAKAGTSSWLNLRFWDSGASGINAWFDLAAGAIGTVQAGCTASISSQGNGWYRCSVTRTIGGSIAFNEIDIGITDGDNTYTATAGASIILWGADLRPANIGANVPAYQRIADANTYDTSGFPLYLRFDGIDDSMYTPANLNLSGTDKVAVFAGVRKLSDAAAGAVTELATSLLNGTFNLAAPSANVALGANFGPAVRGNGPTSYGEDAGSNPAPRSAVLTSSYDLAAVDKIDFRINGATASVVNNGGAAGTGNFGTYPLHIGSRGNSSAWLNGQIYSLIIAGSAVSAGNISATEQWVAQRTGIVIL